jgi:hypothetical protein
MPLVAFAIGSPAPYLAEVDIVNEEIATWTMKYSGLSQVFRSRRR